MAIEETSEEVTDEEATEAPAQELESQADSEEDVASDELEAECEEASGAKRISKQVILSGLGLISLFAVGIGLSLFLSKSGGQKAGSEASQRVKIVKADRDQSGAASGGKGLVSYDMDAFFIPLEGGKAFLKMNVDFLSLVEGWDKKMALKPYEYRETVVRLFENKLINEVANINRKDNLQKEIEITLGKIIGHKFVGKVDLSQMSVI